MGKAARVPALSEEELPVAMSEPEFRAAYDSHFDYVWRSLRRLGAPDRDLDDLAHDTFIAFFRSGYDRARPIKPWLFGIAFRVASDYRRRAQNKYEIAVEHEATDGAPAADEQVTANERRRLVLDALATLDLDRRAVFVMHDIDGHSMPEIADSLCVPLNTCYSRLRLARADFQAAVQRRRGEP